MKRYFFDIDGESVDDIVIHSKSNHLVIFGRKLNKSFSSIQSIPSHHNMNGKRSSSSLFKVRSQVSISYCRRKIRDVDTEGCFLSLYSICYPSGFFHVISSRWEDFCGRKKQCFRKITSEVTTILANITPSHILSVSFKGSFIICSVWKLYKSISSRFSSFRIHLKDNVSDNQSIKEVLDIFVFTSIKGYSFHINDIISLRQRLFLLSRKNLRDNIRQNISQSSFNERSNFYSSISHESPIQAQSSVEITLTA